MAMGNVLSVSCRKGTVQQHYGIKVFMDAHITVTDIERDRYPLVPPYNRMLPLMVIGIAWKATVLRKRQEFDSLTFCQLIENIMSNIWFASDHHFYHTKPHDTFLREDGRFLRYEFATADECAEAMIERHNKVVKPEDRVYFVGDFCFSKKHIHVAGRMNGRKVLIKGNHDTLELKEYVPYFEDVRGCHQFDGVFISHVPIHPQSLGRWGFNIHGHLHAQRILIADDYTRGNSLRTDPRYFNVSVEQINYQPISLEEVKKHKPALELNPRT